MCAYKACSTTFVGSLVPVRVVCCFLQGPQADGSFGSVPRVSVAFTAEDPYLYADRVVAAYQHRRETLERIRYNLYVDCMPQEDLPAMDSDQVRAEWWWCWRRAVAAVAVAATAVVVVVVVVVGVVVMVVCRLTAEMLVAASAPSHSLSTDVGQPNDTDNTMCPCPPHPLRLVVHS